MTELSLEERAWAAYRTARRARRVKGWIGVAIFGAIAGTLWSLPFAVAPPVHTGEVATPSPTDSDDGAKKFQIKPNASLRAGDAPFVFAFGFVIASVLGSFVMGVYETFERRRVAASIAQNPQNAQNAPPTDG